MPTPACDQCGAVTGWLTSATGYGLLCPPCAYRQQERDVPGYGLSPRCWGFAGDDG